MPLGSVLMHYLCTLDDNSLHVCGQTTLTSICKVYHEIGMPLGSVLMHYLCTLDDNSLHVCGQTTLRKLTTTSSAVMGVTFVSSNWYHFPSCLRNAISAFVDKIIVTSVHCIRS